MERQAWMQAAKWLFEQKIKVFPLEMLQIDSEIPENSNDSGNMEFIGSSEGALRVNCGWLAGSAAAMRSGCGADDERRDERHVFLSAAAPEDELRAAHGRCRYLAQTPDEVRKLDALVGPFLPEGYCEDIAIRVWPNGGGAFTAENIPEFARLIRRTEHLAVRAVFLPFDQSGDLSRQAKDAFSLVKKIRSDLPCVLHAFCFEGLLEPLFRGDAELLHTIRMLASLNDTSLYATFFIS